MHGRVDPLGPRHRRVAACVPGPGRAPIPAPDQLHMRDGKPVQRVHASQAVFFEVIDAAAWDRAIASARCGGRR